MISLQEILYKVEIVKVIGATDLHISSIQFDSRKVLKDTLFVAIKGTQTDGHQFISKAIKNGAIVVIAEHIPSVIEQQISYVIVKNSGKALAVLASNFFNNPSEKLKLIGVTGTNGKTTIVSLLYNLFLGMNKKVGMLSSICNKINAKTIKNTHTTPDSLQINELLYKMLKQECEYCFMEVSSHAIDQNRVSGLSFDIVVFTNISHDHLDYHKTFKEYIMAKKKVFDVLSSEAIALVNNDDKNALEMIANTKAKKQTYSLKSMSDFKCKILENRFDGMLLNINNYDLWINLIGEFNAYNVLAVYAVGTFLKKDKEKLLKGISMLTSAEGRFQSVSNKAGVTAIVDYAHTPDALSNVLKTINKIRSGNQKLIIVFGCGGDRDTEKRSKMALIACDLSSKVIITSDNPRSEDPDVIINDMMVGLNAIQKKKTLVIIDRKQAIKTACTISKKEDIILVAGKGHEKYQEIKGVKHSFDDIVEIKESLNLIES